MTRPRDTERIEMKPEEPTVGSDTQRMKPLDPASIEPPEIRKFKYDTDHNGPATEDTELIRGINRARDRIDERKADLDAALKTPTPPPSEPEIDAPRSTGLRLVVFPKSRAAWMYVLYGVVATAVLFALLGLIVKATKPAVGAPPNVSGTAPTVQPSATTVKTSDAASATTTRAPLPPPASTIPTATASAPRSSVTATTSKPAATSKPTPSATQVQPQAVPSVTKPLPTNDTHVPTDNL